MITEFIQDRAGVLLLGVAAAFAAYMTGRSDGAAQCVATQSTQVQAAQAKANTNTRKGITRAAATGHAREADRSRVDARFDLLAEEAHHDPIAPVDDDSCVLPAERLRRWAAANAGGADPGASAAEPDGAASSAASALVWSHARLGGQPPRGDPSVSPAGEPVVPSAAVPGAAER
ncbi:MAG: hypothetical protein K2W93_14140 [Burkholderiaceae bacterium]|nr:hypothetical protein [Burkholderiaceae bacterium]